MTKFNYTFDVLVGSNLDSDSKLEYKFIDKKIADDVTSINANAPIFFSAIGEWEKYALIDFVENPVPGVAFTGWKFNFASLPAYGKVEYGSNVLFVDNKDFTTFKTGTLSYETILHELGHIVIGPDHPPGQSTASVMVEESDAPYVMTPSILDIKTAQAKYGPTTYNSGNTTYKLDGIKIIDGASTWQAQEGDTRVTIWDSGNKDTIDISKYAGTDDGQIDLREGFSASGSQHLNRVGNTYLISPTAPILKMPLVLKTRI